MDGTVYLGDKLLPHAKELFNYLDQNNIEYIFLTNNSSSSKYTYLNKMTSLGIKSKLENYYSSIDHTVTYLKQNKINNIYVLGVDEFKEQLSDSGLVIKDAYIKNAIDAVVVGFDKTVDFNKLTNASLYIQEGAKVIATHPDKRCPIENGYYIPDCGAIIDLLENTYPIEDLTILGKPHPDMLLNILSNKNIETKDALIIGDRYYTDVLCGINANVDSALILTGESKLSDLNNIDYKPKYIFKDLGEVLEHLKNR